MTLIDRLLLRAYSLIILLSAVWMGLWLGGEPAVTAVTRAAVTVDGGWLWVYAAAVFLLAGRYLFFGAGQKGTDSFVKETETGEIRISYGTVVELSQRAARQVRGVERLHARVDESPEGLLVSLHVRALPGIDLTALAGQLQEAVTETIRSATSLAVRAVHVQIAGLAQDAAQR